MPDDVLTRTPPPYDERLSYGADPLQFGELRMPPNGRIKKRGPIPALMNIHGGFWRAKYDLAHAGHLCAALAAAGIATFNLEYRRVGNPGGGWPGSFEDVLSGFRFLRTLAGKFTLDPSRLLVMGHSAGGQLALGLAAHAKGVHAAVSLAGVLDLNRTYELHLSHDAAVEFLGGTPQQVPDHYREASPMSTKVPKEVRQLVVCGAKDDVVPPAFSRDYVIAKKRAGENVSLLELPDAGHFEVIDPQAKAWVSILSGIRNLL